MRLVGLAAVVAMLFVPTAGAQTLGDAAMSPPMALPDSRGADPDLICFMVMARDANAAKKAGKIDATLEAAAGYYVGKFTTHFNDPLAMQTELTKMLVAFKTTGMDNFRLPCIQRYGVTLVGFLGAMRAAQDAK